MIEAFRNPSWIEQRLLENRELKDIPQDIFEEIAEGLNSLKSDDPLVSIVIPVLNEEVSLLRTLLSLSRNATHFKTEVIVVNNNSTDRTQEVLDRVGVTSYFQPKPGWGPARQMGQEKAKGKYILTADADCFYPPKWIQRMTTELQKEGVSCVYGGYSFLASPGKPRWNYSIYESLRNIIAEIRHVKRPWFNCLGMCMGYVKALGLRVGFIDRKIRGEDGRMCFELAQIGKIVRIRTKDVVVWTFPRTLQKDGSLAHAILNRALIEFARFTSYFTNEAAHDTHTSQNFTPSSQKYFKKRKTPVPAKEPDEIS